MNQLADDLAFLQRAVPNVCRHQDPARERRLHAAIAAELERLRGPIVWLSYDGRICRCDGKAFVCRSIALAAAVEAINRYRHDAPPVHAREFVPDAASARTAGDSLRHGLERAARRADRAGCQELATLRDWVVISRDGLVAFNPPAEAPRFVIE